MKIGRPTLKKEDRKGSIAGVRLRSEERALMEKAAAKKQEKLSKWMRKVLVNAAESELQHIMQS